MAPRPGSGILLASPLHMEVRTGILFQCLLKFMTRPSVSCRLPCKKLRWDKGTNRMRSESSVDWHRAWRKILFHPGTWKNGSKKRGTIPGDTMDALSLEGPSPRLRKPKPYPGSLKAGSSGCSDRAAFVNGSRSGGDAFLYRSGYFDLWIFSQ